MQQNSRSQPVFSTLALAEDLACRPGTPTPHEVVRVPFSRRDSRRPEPEEDREDR